MQGSTMAEATEIEKKSLEAHVELCAERYNSLDSRLDAVTAKMGKLELIVQEVHDMIQGMAQKQNDRMINWGIGIIGTLLGVIGWLIAHYVLK